MGKEKKSRFGKLLDEFFELLAFACLPTLLLCGTCILLLFAVSGDKDLKDDPREHMSAYAQSVNAEQLGAPAQPAVTILQEQLLESPEATAFLISWPGAPGENCLATLLFLQHSRGWELQDSGWHCSDRAYTVTVAHFPHHHSIYGFSGGAAQVAVHLPGAAAPRRIYPSGGAYMLLTEQEQHHLHFRELLMLDAAGAELARVNGFR